MQVVSLIFSVNRAQPLLSIRGVHPRVSAALALVLLPFAAGCAGQGPADDGVHELLNVVGLHTDEDDVALVVGAASDGRKVLRLAASLDERVAADVYYLPVATDEPAGESAFAFPDGNASLVRQVESRTVQRGAELSSADTIVIAETGGVERAFLLQEREWFRPAEYLRYAKDQGLVAYFKREPLPERLQGYEKQLTRVEVRGVVDSGRLRVSGRAQSPEYVELVQLRIGDRLLDAAASIERTRVPFPLFPAYAGVFLEFRLEAAWPQGTSGPVVLELLRDQEVLYSGPVEVLRLN